MNVNTNWLPGALSSFSVIINLETISGCRYITRPSAIKTGPDYDELFGSMNKRRPGKLGDIFLSQSVMQQNSWDRDPLDQLRDRSKPGLPYNFQKQARLERMRLQHPTAQICRSS